MEIIFYIAAIVSVIATAAVITRKNAVHALLYMIVSLLAVSVIFFVLGAPFLAALEVIIYAGAIMILFVFVIMMLNMGKETEERESHWLRFKYWIGPALLCLILLAELIYVFTAAPSPTGTLTIISPKVLGTALFGPYILGVELVGMLLMAGVVGAYHIGYKKQKEYHRFLQKDADNPENTELS